MRRPSSANPPANPARKRSSTTPQDQSTEARRLGFVSRQTVLYGPAQDAWPVQSISENPDQNWHPAILLASLPGFMLSEQPYQGFYAEPPIPR